MTTKRRTQSKDHILAGALPALRRSAAKARDLARRTGTRLVVSDQHPTPVRRPKRGRPAR